MLHGSQVVAQGQNAAGLNAGKNGFHGDDAPFDNQYGLDKALNKYKKGPSALDRDE
jgi:hypothetical protein